MEKGYEFLFWAYNVVWIAIAGYVAFLVIRLGQVRGRLETIERKLAAAGPAAGQKSSGS
jgi:CcmD family protein